VGDWITSGDVDGTVEEVGFRSTRVRTFRNSLIYIPNGIITNQTVDNHGLRQYRRFMTHIAVTYDTPPELIDTFVEGLKKLVEEHPNTRKDYYQIHFHKMGDSSLDILFYIFFDVPTWTMELEARHEMLIAIMHLAKALGVNFAFPTRTLHMETFPEKLANSPTYGADREGHVKNLEKFIAGYTFTSK
jgi:MscS family membrane protein